MKKLYRKIDFAAVWYGEETVAVGLDTEYFAARRLNLVVQATSSCGLDVLYRAISTTTQPNHC